MPVGKRESQDPIDENYREEPVCLRYSEGLVIVNNRSSFVRVEWRARQWEW